MDRNREARRLTMAAAGNGLSRRRHKASSLRDSPEVDGSFDSPETSVRDRGASLKKDRDRERDRERERERERDGLSSRSKRSRRERLMMHRNTDDVGDDSSEESVNDDGGGGGGGPPSSAKMLLPSNITPPLFSSSSLSNHHNSSGSLQHGKSSVPPEKVFRATVTSAAAVLPLASSWKASDEMIGFSVPRKARSASTKRSHESRSYSTSGGVFTSGEQIHRQVSTSPARASPASLLASPCPLAPTSPSSSCASVRKRMKPPGLKQWPPKSSSSKSSSSPAENEIEIEIAEVLYGMMRQPLVPSKQEISGNDLTRLNAKEAFNNTNKSTGEAKSRVSSPISNSQSTLPVSAVAPKRKRPRPVKYEEENNFVVPSRSSAILSTTKADIEHPEKTEAAYPNPEKVSGSSTPENGSGLDSTNPTTVAASPGTEKPEGNSSSDLKPLAEETSPSSKKESSYGIRLDDDGLTTTATEARSPYPEEEKRREEEFKIDLMAPLRSSPERVYEMKCLAVEPKPKATDLETEAKPLLEGKEGAEKNACKEEVNQEREEKKLKITAEAESQKQERNVDPKFDLEKSDRDVGSATVNGNRFNHHVEKQPQQQPSSEKTAQASTLPLHMSMSGWPSGLPPMGYMAPLQGVVSMDGSSLSSATMQPPDLFFNQPRPKRCATHCYIARNIHYHQQFTKMNPFWPAAAGSTPLYGAKSCNLNLMPSTGLQGNISGRGSNSSQDKNHKSAANSTDNTAQRKQILLQQALPPGAASNILHGPAFIFPLSQQPHAAAASVRPDTCGNTAVSTGASSSNSMNSSAPAEPAGAPTMSFSYPNMPGNETQYLAILPNNAYPFPVPAHVGAPPGYRGAPGQAIPFFNGSFYFSQMLHPAHLQAQQQQPPPSQAQQTQKPTNQNPSISTGSSAALKNLQNLQQRQGINNGTLHGFPAQKNLSQPLNFQQRQQQTQNAPHQSEAAGKESLSTTDSQVPQSNVTYSQNFVMPMPPPNFGLSGGSVPAGCTNNHGEKKPQQQGSKAGVEPFVSQPFAMSFATISGATTTTTTAPGLEMPSIAQSHATFHSLPEAAMQGYQMMAVAVAAQAAQQKMKQQAQAAQQKMNFRASEEPKAGPNEASNMAEARKATISGKAAAANAGQSIAFSRPGLTDSSVSAVTANNVIDSSARLLNLGSAPPQTSSPNQQQQILQLQKQQQYAAAAAAAAVARSKVPVTSNGSVFSDHNVLSSSVAAKTPNVSGFPQNLVQTSGSPVQYQWKNNNSTRTTTTQVPSPSMSSSSNPSSIKNVTQKRQTRSQQAQISFAANTKSSPSPQVPQAPSINHSPSPPKLVGSPSTSSVSKSGGSPRTTASTSTGNKNGQASSTLSSSQPAKNSPSPSVPNQSQTGARNIVPSILGNTRVSAATSSSGTKSQLPHQQQQPPKHALQQAQLFFSGAYMQPQQQHSTSNINISPASGYYLQRHQQHQGSSTTSSPLSLCSPVSLANNGNTSTSDPAKAIAAAAANNMKGGGLHTQAGIHSSAPYASAAQSAGKTHQLVPPGFPYVRAVPTPVQVKPADQKQPAGE